MITSNRGVQYETYRYHRGQDPVRLSLAWDLGGKMLSHLQFLIKSLGFKSSAGFFKKRGRSTSSSRTEGVTHEHTAHDRLSTSRRYTGKYSTRQAPRSYPQRIHFS